MAAVFADEKRKLLESYLLDFDAELYGKEIVVTIIQHLRERKDFASEAELTDAIENDVEVVREIFRKSC
jgi:riboflavin kinase/FMN adenylyltransferase